MQGLKIPRLGVLLARHDPCPYGRFLLQPEHSPAHPLPARGAESEPRAGGHVDVFPLCRGGFGLPSLRLGERLLGERRALILGFGIQGLFMIGFAWIHTSCLGGIFLASLRHRVQQREPGDHQGGGEMVSPSRSGHGHGRQADRNPPGRYPGGIPPCRGLALAFGWRTSILLVGVITLAFILGGPDRDAPRSPVAGSAIGDALGPASGSPLQPRHRGPFRHGDIRWPAPSFPSSPTWSSSSRTSYLFSSVLAGIYLAVAQAGGIAGRIGWGLVSDYLAGGRRKAILVIIGIIAVVPASSPEPDRAEHPGVLLFLFIGLLGSTTIGYHGVLFGLMGEIVRKEVVGLATGFSLTITFLGIVLFPPLSATWSTAWVPTTGPGICSLSPGLWPWRF